MQKTAYAVVRGGDFSCVAQGIFYVFPNYEEASLWGCRDDEQVVRVKITAEEISAFDEPEAEAATSR